jgi:hypothetical protein
MTPEQINTLLLTCFDGLSKTGTIVIAVFSLWFQGHQERERAKQTQAWQERDKGQQRSWTIEDRNINRKWSITDRQIEERRENLRQHKRVVDEYIKNLLALAARAYMRSIGFKQDALEMLSASYLQSADQSAEIYHHIEAFGNSELGQKFQCLMTTVDEYLVPVLREPERNQDKIENLRGIIAGTTAQVAMTMEKILVEELQPRDWE